MTKLEVIHESLIDRVATGEMTISEAAEIEAVANVVYSEGANREYKKDLKIFKEEYRNYKDKFNRAKDASDYAGMKTAIEDMIEMCTEIKNAVKAADEIDDNKAKIAAMKSWVVWLKPTMSTILTVIFYSFAATVIPGMGAVNKGVVGAAKLGASLSGKTNVKGIIGVAAGLQALTATYNTVWAAIDDINDGVYFSANSLNAYRSKVVSAIARTELQLKKQLDKIDSVYHEVESSKDKEEKTPEE